MKSKVAKGNYYKRRSKLFLEQDGYTVYPMEFMRTIFFKDKKTGQLKTVYSKYDVAGSDLLAMDGKVMWFINVITNKTDVSSHIKRFRTHPYPDYAMCVLHLWHSGAHEPEVIDV
jgi:hypothetical protein